MRKRAFSAILLVVLVLMCLQVGVNKSGFGAVSQTRKLKIYVGPPKVLADNNVYETIFVQLQDSKGAPTRAEEDISIHLSSSLINIGSVDSVITIPSGATYAVARFYSTYTPGTTMITATASGFVTVQESVTTVGPVPSRLGVYCFPTTLPADGGRFKAIVVQLQDSDGSPAKAPIGNVNVTLSSSNTTVGLVDYFVVINAGSTYAVAVVNTTIYAGSAVVTAIASGYISGQAQVTTQGFGGSPTRLKVFVAPPKVPADGVAYEQIVVQLQDSDGKIAQAKNDFSVALSSSNIAVGAVNQSITISQSATYAQVRFYSTYRSGSTTVTAVATDYANGQGSLTTVGPVPSKLAVYCVPSNLPADGHSYEAVVVQLQDSGGLPAKDSVGDVNIDLFSSTPEVGNVESTLVIPFGKTHSVASFLSQYDAGSTTITAITPGYASAQASITTYLIDTYILNVTAAADPSNISSGEQTTIEVYVTYSGLAPTLGATVKLTSDKGGNFSAVTDERNGYYLSTFKAPNVTRLTACTILANVSKTGYVAGQGNVQVTVNPTGNKGSLRIYAMDTGGSPINEASVSSTSQPAGISPLSGLTNQEGLASFDDIVAGSYTIKVEKAGYETNTQNAVVEAGQTTNTTIYLTGEPSTVLGLSLPVFVGVIIAIAVIMAILVVIVVRRRRRRKRDSETSKPTETATEKQD